jgi:hypothetical protein
MKSIVDYINLIGEAGMPVLLLAAASGVVVFVFFFAIIIPSKGRPGRRISMLKRTDSAMVIQQQLDNAQLDVNAIEYIRRSLTFGIPVGIGLALVVGSVSLIGLGIAAGFLTTWTKLEQERDRKQVRYNKQLASACDTVRTSYGVNPSLKKALEAVAEYGEPLVRGDFQEILLAASQERFVEGLEAIAEKRKSIVFDTVASSLIRASEASGEVGEMLGRLAESTRQNVSAFEEAITSQVNARSNIQWGTYGPWAIFCIFRLMTTILSLTTSGNIFAPITGYFSTIQGNLVTMLGALISIFVYRYCNGVAQRGLVVKRVSIVAPIAARGQKPIQPTSQGPVVLSGQTRPVTAGYEVDHA